MNTKAFELLKDGNWSYDCCDGNFTYYDATDPNHECYTLDLKKLNTNMLISICVYCEFPSDTDSVSNFFKNEPWSYSCDDGKLDIHSDDNKKFVRLDLYKLTPTMLDELLVRKDGIFIEERPNHVTLKFMLRTDSYQKAIQLKKVLANHQEETNLECYDSVGEEMYFECFMPFLGDTKSYIDAEIAHLKEWYKQEMDKGNFSITYKTNDERMIISTILESYSYCVDAVLNDETSHTLYYDPEIDENTLMTKDEWETIKRKIRWVLKLYEMSKTQAFVFGLDFDKKGDRSLLEIPRGEMFASSLFAVPQDVFIMMQNCHRIEDNEHGICLKRNDGQIIDHFTSCGAEQDLMLDLWDDVHNAMSDTTNLFVMRPF